MHGVEWIARTPPKRQVEGSNPSEPASILSLYLGPLCYNKQKKDKLSSTTTAYEQQKLKNPMTVFMYALKAPESRRQYPRRFKIFLDYLGLKGFLEEQVQEFYMKAIENHQWVEEVLMIFIRYEKERSKKGEISVSTIPN
jgi:hypothetical protein